MPPTTRRAPAAAPDALLPAIAAALLCYAVFLFAPQVLNDPDSWWHLATGEWILRHHAVPFRDPFSYSFAGRPWVAHEWLSQVLTALAYRADGWSGVVLLYGAAAALAFGLLARHLARWVNPLAALVMTLLAFACVAPNLLARPHVLTLPVLEAWTAGLLMARSRNAAPSPWLLPLMLLWVNLHGSFLFGLALVLPIALEAVVAAAPGERARVARAWGRFLAMAILVSLASPRGWQALVFPFRVMALRANASIGEWQPLNFRHLQPVELALMALLYVALSRGIRLPALRVLMVLGLLHLGLAYGPRVVQAAIVFPLVLAEPLGVALGNSARPPAGRRGRLGAIGVGVVAMLALTALRVSHPIRRGDGPTAPITALALMPADLRARPVFNDFDFGGYLIYAHVRPFVDGRADMYGDAFLTRYLQIMRPDPAAFRRAAATYGFAWTLLRTGSPAAAMMDAMQGWRRLYAGPIATVHVRTDALPR